MELCLFQGTFNPIHNAHLRVANYVIDNCGIKKIIFIPAFVPPHKPCDIKMAEHRLNMVKLAIENNNKFQISDIEYRLGGTSYTYRTICELCKEYLPENKIKFIIGTDAFRHIESWYETDKLKEMLRFLVFLRDSNFNESEFNYLNKKGYDFEIMPLKFEDISSTELRNFIRRGTELSKFVPHKVEEYIRKHGLYKT